MAAVMALVFIFAIASAGLMVKVTAGGLSVTTAFAVMCFVALATGVVVGALVEVKHGERGE